MNSNKKNLAVFISGSGTNFDAVQKAILNNRINCEIKILFSSNPNALALEKAANYKIDSCIIQRKNFEDYEKYTDHILDKLKKYNIDFIILAGYLKMIPAKIIKSYSNKIINIHPALLPKFGGKGMHGIHVHEAVLEAGEKETGPTVHFVDEIYDNGLIIMQYKVTVEESDTPYILQQRVLEQEHKILPDVVQLLCNDKIKIENNKVLIQEVERKC